MPETYVLDLVDLVEWLESQGGTNEDEAVDSLVDRFDVPSWMAEEAWLEYRDSLGYGIN